VKAGCSGTGVIWAAALVVSLAALTLSGCGGGGGTTGPASATGIIVADGTFTPIAGATVKIDGQTGTTDESGAFNLTNLASGEQPITVTVSGGQFQTYSSTVALLATANDLGTIYISPVTQASNGAVRGRVLDQNSQPVSGANIQLGLITSQSRADGTFMVYNVPPASYTMVVTYGDLTASVPDVQVQAGQTTDVGDVALSAGPPPPPF